jgi:hypothetical protein
VSYHIGALYSVDYCPPEPVGVTLFGIVSALVISHSDGTYWIRSYSSDECPYKKQDIGH